MGHKAIIWTNMSLTFDEKKHISTKSKMHEKATIFIPGNASQSVVGKNGGHFVQASVSVS